MDLPEKETDKKIQPQNITECVSNILRLYYIYKIIKQNNRRESPDQTEIAVDSDGCHVCKKYIRICNQR